MGFALDFSGCGAADCHGFHAEDGAFVPCRPGEYTSVQTVKTVKTFR
jgi:hypothetical protein